MQARESTTQWLHQQLAGGPLPNLCALAESTGRLKEVLAAMPQLGIRRTAQGWALPASVPAAAPVVAAIRTTPTATATTAPAAMPAPAARVVVPTIDAAEIYASRRGAVERARAGSPIRTAAQSVAGTPHRTASADDVYAARRQQVARARGAV